MGGLIGSLLCNDSGIQPLASCGLITLEARIVLTHLDGALMKKAHLLLNPQLENTLLLSHLLAVMGGKNLPTHMGSWRRDRLLWKTALNHWKATATSVTVNWVVLLADTNFLFSMAIFILASQFLLHLALIVWHSYAKQNNIYRGWKQATLGGMQACPLLCVTSLFSMCTRRNASQVTWRRKPDCSHLCPIVIKTNTWRMAGFR